MCVCFILFYFIFLSSCGKNYVTSSAFSESLTLRVRLLYFMWSPVRSSRKQSTFHHISVGSTQRHAPLLWVWERVRKQWSFLYAPVEGGGKNWYWHLQCPQASTSKSSKPLINISFAKHRTFTLKLTFSYTDTHSGQIFDYCIHFSWNFIPWALDFCILEFNNLYESNL